VEPTHGVTAITDKIRIRATEFISDPDFGESASSNPLSTSRQARYRRARGSASPDRGSMRPDEVVSEPAQASEFGDHEQY